MRLFIPVRRATLLVPSGPEHDPNRKHLFILLTDPPNADSEVLLVSLASVQEHLPYDSTCLLYPGDHPFIRHKSYVNYAYARIEPVGKLVNGVKQRLFDPQGTLDETVFARVCKGLLESRHTTPKIRKFYEDAQTAS
jgi:hypothetical protein